MIGTSGDIEAGVDFGSRPTAVETVIRKGLSAHGRPIRGGLPRSGSGFQARRHSLMRVIILSGSQGLVSVVRPGDGINDLDLLIFSNQLPGPTVYCCMPFNFAKAGL